MTTLFYWSNQCFNISSVLYAFTFVLYAGQLVSTRKMFNAAPSWMARIAWLGHTTALGLRWADAGIAHPPWTNLYESLVFFSWGVMGVHLFLEARLGFKFTGVFASAVTLAAMGVASLHPHKEIEPLVPALQSWWLLFHVFMACIAYSFFLGSSFASIFYLLKDRVRVSTMAGFACLVAVLFLTIAAGKQFFLTGNLEFFKVVQMQAPSGMMQDVIMDMRGPDGKPVQQFIALPWGAAIMWPLIALYLAAAGLLLCSMPRRKSDGFQAELVTHPVGADVLVDAGNQKLERFGKIAMLAAIILHVGLIVDIFVATSMNKEMALKSNPYRLTAVVMTLGISFFFASLFKLKDQIIARLPSETVLDRWGYQAILIGVPFMTLNLISGGVWAFYAWGRYWGWDPKETWAFITWCTYVVYLHTRILGGWRGRKTAIISVLGFFIVIFTYLGVNLVISGLHSYATN